MKTIAKKSYWRYLLFWLGIALAIAGLSAATVSGNWGPLPLGLLIAGIGLCVLWLLLQARATKWWSRRSTRAGTNALVATLSVLIILGLANYLGTRYSVRRDLTETGLYTLSSQSSQLVQNLSAPVKVWVFDRSQNQQDRELLENYRRQGQEFSFEFVDPQTRPGLAEKFGVKNFGEVHLEAGEQRRLVQTLSPEERLSESRLTNSLQQISSDRTTKVYFLQGHGEEAIPSGQPGNGAQGRLSQAVSGLSDKSYTVEPLNLAQQPAVPADATVVVVAGPQRSLLESEIKALTAYLNQGGNLLLLVDPDTNPGLNSLLKDWGVTLDQRLVIDPAAAGAGLGPTVPLVNNYGAHPITQDFGNGISIYREARPIEIVPVEGVQATPLLLTSAESWAESNLESQNLQFDPKSDLNGPLTLGVALSRPVKAAAAKPSPSPEASPTPGESKQPPESRLVAIGDSDFATDGLFERQLNGDVLLNSVGWLSQQDEQLLAVRPREAKNRRINLNPQQASILGLTALAFVPLLGFLVAIILWWRRR